MVGGLSGRSGEIAVNNVALVFGSARALLRSMLSLVVSQLRAQRRRRKIVRWRLAQLSASSATGRMKEIVTKCVVVVCKHKFELS
jgi:hypothetical protein